MTDDNLQKWENDFKKIRGENKKYFESLDDCELINLLSEKGSSGDSDLWEEIIKRAEDLDDYDSFSDSTSLEEDLRIAIQIISEFYA